MRVKLNDIAFIDDAVWFGNVGIVRVELPYGVKHYIGSPPNFGLDQVNDMRWIAMYGTRYHDPLIDTSEDLM